MKFLAPFSAALYWITKTERANLEREKNNFVILCPIFIHDRIP